VVLDVAHNPEAAAMLAQNLADMGSYPATYAVFGMLRDKDIEGVCAALKGRIGAWYTATLSAARGAQAATLAQAIRSTDPGAEVSVFDSPSPAFGAACKRAGGNDRIVVFGSFYTVAEVMAAQAPGSGR
jgi:dihydrofolate synthase/folylpolyglutamate synthase